MNKAIKKFQDEVIAAMFYTDTERNDRGNPAGYPNIVYTLITDGSCISTIHALEIDFGQCREFITSKKSETGIDLITFCFDRKKCLKSELYAKASAFHLRQVEQWRDCAVSEMADLQKDIDRYNEIITLMKKEI